MKNTNLQKIVLTGLFAALSYVTFTFLQIKITLPGGDATSIHLGNAVCVIGADGGGGNVPYQNKFCGRLSDDQQFVVISDERVKDDIEKQTADCRKNRPEQHLLFVFFCRNVSDSMRNQSGPF